MSAPYGSACNHESQKETEAHEEVKSLLSVKESQFLQTDVDSIETGIYVDNLLQREFECYEPRMVLLTDITYISYNSIFAFLLVSMDAYTKEILSYVMSELIEIGFVRETVEILIRDHGINLHKETIIHSDKERYYTSITVIRLLKVNEIKQSMSRRGNCWDNAPKESFSGHMKDHLTDRLSTATTSMRLSHMSMVTWIIATRIGMFGIWLSCHQMSTSIS